MASPRIYNLFASFYSKRKGEDNTAPHREWLRLDVSDPAASDHLICATFLHIFTVSLGVTIMLALYGNIFS